MTTLRNTTHRTFSIFEFRETMEKLLPRPRFWRHLIGAIFMSAACVLALGWATV